MHESLYHIISYQNNCSLNGRFSIAVPDRTTLRILCNLGAHQLNSFVAFSDHSPTLETIAQLTLAFQSVTYIHKSNIRNTTISQGTVHNKNTSNTNSHFLPSPPSSNMWFMNGPFRPTKISRCGQSTSGYGAPLATSFSASHLLKPTR